MKHVTHAICLQAPTTAGTTWLVWHAEYVYNYAPDSLLCRMLCRLFALRATEVLEAWRFGAVIRRNGHVCYVSRAHGAQARNQVVVTVCGAEPQVLGALVSSKLKELIEDAFAGIEVCVICTCIYTPMASFPALLYPQTHAFLGWQAYTACGARLCTMATTIRALPSQK